MIRKPFPLLIATVILFTLLAACANQDDIPPAALPDSSDFSEDASWEDDQEEMVPDESEAESAMDSMESLPEASEQGPNQLAPPPPQSSEPPSAAEPSQPEAPAATGTIEAQLLPQAEEPEDLPPSRIQATRIEQELLRLINEERQQNGVEALGLESSMQFAAQIRAEEALESLSHTRPDGTPYHTAFDVAGFPYAGKWHGENLAILKVGSAGYDESVVAQALFAEWVGSPGHYQNMLGEHFQQTGVGVHVETDGDVVTIGSAQLFASL